MNVLNLGAGGFVGSHLTHRLLTEGHSVTAVDLWSDKVREMLDHPRLQTVKWLLTTDDAHEMYRQLGFGCNSFV